MIIITPAALALVRPLIMTSEGLRLKVYQNAHDVPTQGYGHTSGITSKSPPCTIEQAIKWLDSDIMVAGRAITAHVTHPLNNHQVAALLDFIFNLGSYNFDTSTLLKDINLGIISEVPAQIARWVHDSAGKVLPGLVTRREAEIKLFNTPD